MNAPAVVRIGAVSYLNTRPLVCGLGRQNPSLRLSFDLPSRLADDLAAGHLDVALIPCIEFFQEPDYVLVSDACIACRGPVLSVKLLSRVPPPEIATLALDEGSRTSVALARILLQQRHGVRPELSLLPIGAAAESAAADAVLLIGDRAIHAPADVFPYQWDLGEQWCRWAGRPFVFAVWAARRGRDWSAVSRALEQARDRGVGRLPEIAAAEAPQVGLSVDACLGYLRDNLHFCLGPDERQGLARFRQLAHDLSLAPAPDEAPLIAGG